MNIGVDIDDVVQECVSSILNFYNRMHNDHVSLSDVRTWDFVENLPELSSNPYASRSLIDYFTQVGMFRTSPAVPGAVESLKELKGAGHEIFFITSRNSRAISDTYRWFHEQGLDHKRIFFDRDKAWHAEQLSLDYMIDDGNHNLESIKDSHPSTKTILYRRPWNYQDSNCDYTVDSWSEIKQLLLHR